MCKLGNGEGFLKGYVGAEEFLIENTKEQISAFIIAFSDEHETTLVNMMDMPEITTFGGFINKCSNQVFLPELLEVLVPQQMGIVEPIQFTPLGREQ